ncbi:TetR/AcrR family transcriptional regulator [Propionibacteriaceae bacterium Y1685]|uniref:TetR/AcrR family transcriptional regulator n=1 Tax=Microlunatus sp. Y1700 TaxID=3418487 RepID=UPI003B76E177
MTSTRVARLPRDQRRSQLLDAAAEVFTTKGFHAAAMDDIAEIAGVSKPVLYQHFSSKLELYVDLVDQSCERLLSIIRAALSTTEVNRDRVVATMGGFYHFVNEQRADFRLVFESDLTSEPAVRDRLNRVNDDIAEAVAQVIAEDTELSHERAKLLAISLTGVAQVSARYWAAGSDEISLDEAIELVSRLVWRGIRGFPRTTPPHAPDSATQS